MWSTRSSSVEPISAVDSAQRVFPSSCKREQAVELTPSTSRAGPFPETAIAAVASPSYIDVAAALSIDPHPRVLCNTAIPCSNVGNACGIAVVHGSALPQLPHNPWPAAVGRAAVVAPLQPKH